MQMMLFKCTVLAVLAISMAGAAPDKVRFVMRGVKRDASHIANYYLPPHSSGHQQHGGYSGGALGNAQHLQVLDVKLPQTQGHYIPSYALPSKTYESNAHHFHVHSPQFTHSGPQYALNSAQGGKFEELSNILSTPGSSAAGHFSFGGQTHGASAAPQTSYSYSHQSFGHQAGASLSGHQSAAQGGYTFASVPQTQETAKAGPLSFGGATQSAGHIQQQQQPQAQAHTGHQFGFTAGAQEHQQVHQQQAVAAPQVTYIPQDIPTSSGHSAAAQTPAQTTPVYAVGMKGLGHYATHGPGSHQTGATGASSASAGHGISLAGHSLGGLTYMSNAHGGYYLDTSALKGLNIDMNALKGLNLGTKYVVMSKPTALTYGQSYGYQAPKYVAPKYVAPKYIAPVAAYHGAAASSAGGYKSSAPFKPSVFLGATQENVSEYEHGSYGQEAVASGYSTGSEYKYASPSVSYGAVSGSHY